MNAGTTNLPMRASAAILLTILVAALTTLEPASASDSVAASATATPARADRVVPGEAIVRYRDGGPERVVEIDPEENLQAELDRLEADPEVRWAIPNALARVAVNPNDPGRSGVKGGWRKDQWNFLNAPPTGTPCSAEAPCGVGAPRAWSLLESAGHREGRRKGGGRGPIVAVVDTGVAYRNKGKRFTRSPDFAGRQFVGGRDFVDGDRIPLDRNGHGTHVASTIAERTDNAVAVTSLAPGVRIMPVRVLGGDGSGGANDVAKGIRWAARHGARVINLSLEFPRSFDSCKALRSVCMAIRKAEKRGSIVVAAAGNVGTEGPQMPGKITFSVAASTIRGCISEFSSSGPGVDITAPGGGSDAPGGGSQCLPAARGPGVVQLTLRIGPALRGNFSKFGYPRYEGTSMSTPHVSAAAALVWASRILHRGKQVPTPAEVEAHLECTARAVADPQFAPLYGAGILDLAAAVDRADPAGCLP